MKIARVKRQNALNHETRESFEFYLLIYVPFIHESWFFLGHPVYNICEVLKSSKGYVDFVSFFKPIKSNHSVIILE